MLRMISQEVVQENADMILSEDANADLGVINETIFENLKRMMSQSGGTVSQEDMESLIGEVISRNTSETPSVEESNVLPEEPEVEMCIRDSSNSDQDHTERDCIDSSYYSRSDSCICSKCSYENV